MRHKILGRGSTKHDNDSMLLFVLVGTEFKTTPPPKSIVCTLVILFKDRRRSSHKSSPDV